jgi:hypothetical protein
MTRTHLLSAALPAAALLALAGAPAAACTPGTDAGGAPTLSCDAPGLAPVASDADGLTVTIAPGASLESASRDAPPLALGGAGQSVVNAGTIRNADPRNNTDGIQATGNDLAVDNSGLIQSGDRAIHVLGGASGFTLINREGAEIRARRQAVRTEDETASQNGRVENFGLISSTNGRAIQMRGTGSSVLNMGTLIGGEEVIEGRLDFAVENHGLIAIRGLSWDPATMTWTDTGEITDEDGIQFASGTLDNHGVILATDDGLDIDEGLVINRATGVIVSAAPDDAEGSSGIDLDNELQDPILDSAGLPLPPPGLISIVNEGRIEGPRAIGADRAAPQPVSILNSGTLIGRGGNAIDLAPVQGDTTIALFGASVVEGDILFGAGGLNTLILGPFETGASFGGAVAARGPGDAPAGFDVEFAMGLGLGDILGHSFGPDSFALTLRAGAGSLGFDLLGVESFLLDGSRFTASEFAALLDGGPVGAIPLPAAGWLLLGGFGLLAGLRRARRAA